MNGDTYVTPTTLREEITEIKQELDKLPTRWEVRTLILLALVAGRFIPAELPGQAQAAAHAALGVFI